jgi:YD repeat-containing protein
LNYSYNLAGQLASYTSFGNSVSYTRDATGRLTGVSGSPFGGVTQYVNNIKYRAWGGRKELSYGNNHTGTTQYNSRLLPTNYSLTNAMTRSYSYFADGRLQSSSLSEDGSFNRNYEYDLAGRLKSDSTPNNFAQNLTYDVWGNATQSNGWHWSQFIFSSGTYTNNRHSNWQYNAAGQVTNNQDNVFQYDAAGRTSHIWTQGGVTNTGDIIYDGDGQVIRSSGSASYTLRSTVLGGRVVAELLNNGQRMRGFVYAEGEEVLAIQYEGTNHVAWEHHDPAEQSFRMVESSSVVVDEREETASGAKIEKEDPYPSNPNFTGADTDGAYPFIGTVGKPITGCTMEGIHIPDCSRILRDVNPFEYYESLAGVTFRRWVDPSSHRKPIHPADPDDDDIVRIYTDKEKLSGWEEWDVYLKLLWVVKTPISQGPQKPLVQDDPETIQGDSNTNACTLTVSFKSGTFYEKNSNQPNGPSNVTVNGRTFFGLGFTVSGTVRGGNGIGRIGYYQNPENPKGRWIMEQWTSSYAMSKGEILTVQGRRQIGDEAWMDLDLNGIFSAPANSNKYSRYDHPSIAGEALFKNQSFFVKVYNGDKVCYAAFHIVQRGNTIHWGKGAVGVWPK